MAHSTHREPAARSSLRSTARLDQNGLTGKAGTARAGSADRMLQQGREMSEGMQHVAGNFKVAIDRSLRDEPMSTLALATALGFALGAIWRS